MNAMFSWEEKQSVRITKYWDATILAQGTELFNWFPYMQS